MNLPTNHDEILQPKDLVQLFLRRLKARDLAGAEALLAPDVEMIFPGGVRCKRLTEFIELARSRYRRVAKRTERMDMADTEDGSIVICQGVLHGTWSDGEVFEDIRCADRFLIRNGLIQRQHVWNDLAEAAAKRTLQVS